MTALIPSLFFVGLSLLDSMRMTFIAPILVAQIISVSQSYYLSRQLVAPLWMARSAYFVGAFGAFSCLALAYKLLNLNVELDDSRKVMLNMQK